MFKKRLRLKSFMEDVDIKINNTNTKNDGPGYYPETKRGREFYDAHAKANPVIDKTGSPETQFKSNLKKVNDHGPPKVDSYAGDPHANAAIKSMNAEMIPRRKLQKEETEELTEESWQQLDESVRKAHYQKHHQRAADAAAELQKHLSEHSKLMGDPRYNKSYYDMYNIKDIASKVEDAALSMGEHVENDKRYIESRNNDAKLNSPMLGVRESLNEEKKYRSSAFTIRDLLKK